MGNDQYCLQDIKKYQSEICLFHSIHYPYCLHSTIYLLQIAFWIEVSIAEVSISAGRFFTSYFTLHCASLFSISDVKLPSTNHTVKASDI